MQKGKRKSNELDWALPMKEGPILLVGLGLPMPGLERTDFMSSLKDDYLSVKALLGGARPTGGDGKGRSRVGLRRRFGGGRLRADDDEIAVNLSRKFLFRISIILGLVFG